MKKVFFVMSIFLFFFASCGDDAYEITPEIGTYAIEEPRERFAELLDFQEALEVFTEGMEAEILDIETGITYRVRRVTGGYNTLADVETLTLQDTERLLETAGGEWNIRRRAVIVMAGERRIAASIAPFEHSGSEEHPFGEIIDNRSGGTGTGVNLNYIRGNGMVGVVDIFFFNSLIPGINRVDERHQEMVLRAYDFEG
ncbi:MAG: hypothetical protein FWF81_14660 [Defluviitaleaceae bacterium]|nr:hypothetical protein [Defluviitaleaceae bacterium]